MPRPDVLPQDQRRLAGTTGVPRARPDSAGGHRRKSRLITLLPALGLALLLLGCSLGTSSNGDDATAEIITLPTLSVTRTPLPTTAPPSAVEPAATLAPDPASTPAPDATRPITHVVAAGEVLGSIALQYDITVEELVAANDIDDPNMIQVGQVLIIPIAGAPPVATPTTEVEPIGEAPPAISPTLALEPTPFAWDWTPAILEGNLDAAYTGTLVTDRFTIHYTPGTYPEVDLDNVSRMLQKDLAHLEALWETQLAGHFDVYVAGALFAPPDQALRGRSFSAARRTFFLHDGTGNQADQQYISAHEMTHLFAWNAFGRPVSAMLSEGAAVYAGMELIADSAHMPIDAFCGAYQQAGALPRVSSNLAYGGHIRDLPNYYAAGCFVGYLVETYGPEPFRRLYPTGDFNGAYGKSLAALETDWIAALEAGSAGADVDAQALIAAVDGVSDAYDRLFAVFSGTPGQYAAYMEIDAARLALIEGRLSDVQPHLDAMAQALAQ